MGEIGATGRRNWVVWLFLILAVLAAIGAFVDALRYLGVISIAQLGDLKFFLEDANWLGAILSGLVGVLWIVVARWLWTLNPQGWMFVIVLAGLNIVLLVLAMLGNTTLQAVLPALIVCVVILLLAFLPGTKRAFGA
jgi:hypothetical protein